MPIGGNTTPKKVKKPVGSPWACKCSQNPHYLVMCPRCGKGQGDK